MVDKVLKIILYIFFGFIAFMLFLGAIEGINSVLYDPTAKGVITSVDTEHHESGTSLERYDVYETEIKYTFRVNGQSYTGRYTSKSTAKSTKYQVGDSITISYDSKYPEDNHPASVNYAGLVGGGLLVFGAISVVLDRRKKRLAAQENDEAAEEEP